jgi:hypothetical protein
LETIITCDMRQLSSITNISGSALWEMLYLALQ